MGLSVDDQWSPIFLPKSGVVSLLNYGLRDLVLVEWEGHHVLIYKHVFHERTVRLAR